ncbi:MAG: lytic transglycosylase domain-containing protein [Acidimicrobiales bacterium]
MVIAAAAAVAVAGQASYSSASLPNQIVVSRGDTLWGIATANGLSVARLAAANNMSPDDLLLIGRRLVIPTSGPAPSSGSGAAATAPPGPLPQASFCADATFSRGPYGQVPALLQSDPGRLALRPLLAHWAGVYGLAPALVEAVGWQESGWQEAVKSPAGAIGIGQLLPGTADFVNADLLGTSLSPYSASDNVELMSAFLAYLVRQVGNNACMVAAAYYQGPAALARYGVFPETQRYVRDVLALETRFE